MPGGIRTEKILLKLFILIVALNVLYFGYLFLPENFFWARSYSSPVAGKTSGMFRSVRFIEERGLAIPSEGKALVANLSEKTLFLFNDGVVAGTLPIVSIGKSGAPWETPAGRFSILSKSENHFSSIGYVWMPYSLRFVGNYFIHGWPYYIDKTPVELGYSGGCIRLATKDAKIIFEFAEAGTPLVIHNADAKSEKKGEYENLAGINLSNISAGSYLVADIATGEVLIEKNADVSRPIASITKLMTALVALDEINPSRSVIISPGAVETPGETGGLSAGEILLAQKLIYPLLLESSNDAAEALAEAAGRKLFLKKMNERAVSLGLTKTSFADPSGIDAGNVSTAEDIFRLVKHLFNNKKYIFDILKTVSHVETNHVWRNNNPFIGEEGFFGGKAGETTAAGETFVNLMEVDFGSQNKRILAFIVLKSADRDGDIRVLLEFVRKNVTMAGQKNMEALESGQVTVAAVGDIMLDRGVKQSVLRNGGGFFFFFSKY